MAKRGARSGENHWKHKNFVENIPAAAGKITSEDARPEWNMVKIGPVVKGISRTCELCGTPREKTYVQIESRIKKNSLFIGSFCWEKFVHYQLTGQFIFKSNGMYRGYVGKIRKYVKKNLLQKDKHGDGTYLAWLDKQDLATDLRRTVELIKATRYAENIPAAEALVLYYRTHRRYPLLVLLTKGERLAVECDPKLRQRFPRMVTQVRAEEIQREIAQWQEQKRKREEELRLAERLRQQQEWKRFETHLLAERERREREKREAREAAVAEMERLVIKKPECFAKGVFRWELYRDPLTGFVIGQWFFRQNGRKYILENRYGWTETSESSYVIVTRTQGKAGRIHFVWPLELSEGEWLPAYGFEYLCYFKGDEEAADEYVERLFSNMSAEQGVVTAS